MAPSSDVNVDDLRRRARRRLVGAIVLALSAAVFVPMLLESEPRPLGEDVSVKIPPVDNDKFVNKLTAKGDAAKPAPARAEPLKAEAPKAEMSKAGSPRSDAAAADPAAILAGGPTNVPAPSAASAGNAADATTPAATRKSLAEAEQKVLSSSGRVQAGALPPPVSVPATKAAAPADAAPKAESPKGDAVKAEPGKAEVSKADTSTAVAAGPGFSVQLAAFTDDKGANSLVNKLTKAGHVAYVEPVTNSKGTMWRVRVGPFPTREAAGTSRDKLKGDGYSGIVTPSK